MGERRLRAVLRESTCRARHSASMSSTTAERRASASELDALINSNVDMVVVDSRPFDEYQRVSIPTSTNVPGAELALRIHDIAPKPETLVVVNCAGRTRSIIGAQSLINAGIPEQGRGVAKRHDGLQPRWIQNGQRQGQARPRLIGAGARTRQASGRSRRQPLQDQARQSRHHRMLAQRTSRIARSICSTSAIRRNTPPATCRARSPHRAASSCRRPTNTPARSARASC